MGKTYRKGERIKRGTADARKIKQQGRDLKYAPDALRHPATIEQDIEPGKRSDEDWRDRADWAGMELD